MLAALRIIPVTAVTANGTSLCEIGSRSWLTSMNILALQYPDSGKLSTDVPDVDTGIDWLVYLARYSQQCQAQSHFVVLSRLDIYLLVGVLR